MPHRRCIVCGSDGRLLLYAQRFSVIQGTATLPGYDVACCRRCGACYADRVPSQAALNVYYRAMSKYEKEVSFETEGGPEAARLDRTTALLASWVTDRRARILEVGCAAGGLLHRLRVLGYSHISGIDPSRACSATARRRGLNVKRGTIADLTGGPRYDLIVLVGVLEHISDVSAAVAGLRRSLGIGGKLYLEVPDAATFHRRRGTPFQQFSMEHINFFSADSLTGVVEAAGFRCLRVRHMSQPIAGGFFDPVVAALFEAGPESRTAYRNDRTTATGIRAYVRRCRAQEKGLRRAISRLAARGVPIIVWGTGSLTLRLLALGGLDRVPIRAFVDSNPRYQGKRLRGAPILAPAGLDRFSDPVLISTSGFQREIEREIRRRGLSNEVLRLDRLAASEGRS